MLYCQRVLDGTKNVVRRSGNNGKLSKNDKVFDVLDDNVLYILRKICLI